MKYIVVCLTLLIMMTSCARKVEVSAPNFVNTGKYAYVKDGTGRVWIFTTTTQDFDKAMKDLHPGPASVDKLNLWVVTPAQHTAKKEAH